jgi:hypothetical protein
MLNFAISDHRIASSSTVSSNDLFARMYSAMGMQSLFTMMPSANVHRVVNNYDIVPILPPELIGYRHHSASGYYWINILQDEDDLHMRTIHLDDGFNQMTPSWPVDGIRSLAFGNTVYCDKSLIKRNINFEAGPSECQVQGWKSYAHTAYYWNFQSVRATCNKLSYIASRFVKLGAAKTVIVGDTFVQMEWFL